MKTHKTALTLVILTIVYFGLLVTYPQLSYANEVYTVSLKNISLKQGERIVGFTMRVSSASIHSIPKLPIGWNYKISNSLNEQPPCNTILDASIGVGNAALYPNFFDKFVTIEKYKGRWAEDIEFDLEVKLKVTTDFDKYTVITLGLKDLTLKRLGGE